MVRGHRHQAPPSDPQAYELRCGSLNHVGDTGSGCVRGGALSWATPPTPMSDVSSQESSSETRTHF
ncbi:hypothetical protein E2C01_017232 [Portunus trituberculatus]|uniref:Uncharacterized protein n=1 Tax=Portunus trituberculatus TaxID=210409 RepID=A0A5B7DT73_PORTR|nr:hypothetical protein [Portunus trituberculatus]